MRATPRSYERVSKTYKMYKEQQDTIPRSVFLNVIKGNVGKVIAEEFVSFVESNYSPLISFGDVFSGENLDSNRLKIIDLLSSGEKCACEILKFFDITQSTLSHHIKILSECLLVKHFNYN